MIVIGLKNADINYMRLDHVAYRVRDRKKAAQFFIDALGYSIGAEFRPFENEGPDSINYNILCIALVPSEKKLDGIPWASSFEHEFMFEEIEYHMAPEIFVSDGPEGSIVGDWVKLKGPGVHHIAYQVDKPEDVDRVMKDWQEKGYAEFLSEKPLQCEVEDPELRQVFTKPSELTGIIYEFIHRGEHGFCSANVKSLMKSTEELSNEK